MGEPTEMGARAPVAIFAYRRLDHLRRLFNSLANCNGFAESDVTIFIDGFKGDIDRRAVVAVREFACALSLPNVHVSVADSNRGLRRSIFEGVDSLVRQHGRVIVLEEDLQLSPVALDYFNAALDAYEHSERVKAICGYMYDLGAQYHRDTCFFLPFASSWGWATWDRAWSGFSVETDDYKALSLSKSFRRLFAAPHIIHSNLILDAQLRGLVDSWAVLWNAHIATQGGMCLFPPKTLVRNGGFSTAGATHSSRLNPLNSVLSTIGSRMEFATIFRLPEAAEVDYAMTDIVARTPHTRLQRTISLLGYVRRRAKRIVQGGDSCC